MAVGHIGHAMATSLIVAGYRQDFTTGQFPAHWQYMWNKPTGWDSGSADLTTGRIGDLGCYAPLKRAGNVYTPDGDTNYYNNAPAGFLAISQNGGHPGHPGSGPGRHDRYAIAAYTIQSDGYYRITKSFLQHKSAAGSGLHLVVHIDDHPLAYELRSTTDYAYSFDVTLGELQTGQTVYVGVGAAGNASYDSYNMDFQIEQYDPVVAGYRRDFRPLIPRAGWQYLWNQPQGWGGVDIHHSSHRVGKSSRYHPLIAAADRYVPDPVESVGAPLFLGAYRGHPGLGEPGYGRYAIAAYTVSDDGFYKITDSVLRTIESQGSGLHLLLHVDDCHPYADTVFPHGLLNDFDCNLGYLNSGNTIYVAVGSVGPEGQDAFELDFSVMQYDPILSTRRSRIPAGLSEREGWNAAGNIFTVSAPGRYALGQSWIEVKSSAPQAATVRVTVNDQLILERSVQPGKLGDFDCELGRLADNEKICVQVVGCQEQDCMYDYEIALADTVYQGAVQVLHVSDFGAAGDGVTNDGPRINDAIAVAMASREPTIIEFDGSKIYRVTSKYAFNLQNAENIYIKGNGAKISLRHPARFAIVDDARNVTLEGLTMYYNPIPYFQAEIVGYNVSAGTLDVKVQPQYPMPALDDPSVTDNRSTWAFGHTWGDYRSHFWIKTVKEIDPSHTAQRIIRMQGRDETLNRIENMGKKAQGIIVPVPRVGQQGNYTLHVRRSGHIVFRDLLIQTAPQFICDAIGNTGPIRFENVDIRVAAEGERFVSWRDAFHVKQNRFGPAWEDCDFDGWAMQDDLWNLTSVWARITNINGNNPKLLNTTYMAEYRDVNWNAGDWVTAQRPGSGVTVGSARVVTVSGTGSTINLELDREIPGLVVGDRLFNEQMSNRGAVIRRCRTYQGDAGQASVRTRTPTLFEDNYFHDMYIWIHAESSEGPIPERIVFRRNHFKADQLRSRLIDTGYDCTQPAANSIIYEDNVFEHGTIGCKNAKNVSFVNNNFLATDNQYNVMQLNNCMQINLAGNRINGWQPGNMLNWVGRTNTPTAQIAQGQAGPPVRFVSPEAAMAPLPESPYSPAVEIEAENNLINFGPRSQVIGFSAQASGSEAKQLIDGISTFPNRWRAEGYPQWVEIDLGSDKHITETNLETMDNRAYQYVIETRPTNGAYTVLVDRSNNRDMAPMKDTFVPTTARYVKLTVTGAHVFDGVWVVLHELRIIGYDDSPSVSSVQLFMNGQLVSTLTEPPFIWQHVPLITDLGAGRYNLKAIAHGQNGMTSAGLCWLYVQPGWPLGGDVNRDGLVDLRDFSMFGTRWLSEPDGFAQDDLMILIENWMENLMCDHIDCF